MKLSSPFTVEIVDTVFFHFCELIDTSNENTRPLDWDFSFKQPSDNLISVNLFSSILKWWKQRQVAEERHELYVVLKQAGECKNYEDRVLWLRSLFGWIRSAPIDLESTNSNLDPENISSLRLKFLLQSLYKNEDWRNSFIKTFKETILEISSIEFFSEIGLNYQGSFINEFTRRVMDKLLIEGSPKKDLKTFLFYIFPSENDSQWIDLIDAQVINEFIGLFRDTDPAFWHPLKKDIENAILLMVKKVQAIGLGPTIRQRVPYDNFRTLPFFELSDKAYKFIFSYDNKDLDQNQLDTYETDFLNCIQRCRILLLEVYTYLESHGVSIGVVFSLEQMFRQLDRIALLVRLRTSKVHQAKLIRMFLSQFVIDLHNSQTISSFVGNNIQLILRKVVQRNSEIGEGYFAETKKQYYAIFSKSLGGGFITGFTVVVKFLIQSLPISQFMSGALAATNYAISFLTIQLMGYTLATKQPASTAPTLAKKLKGAQTENEIEVFIQDTMYVLRSQVSSVFGNIIAVAPTCALFSFIFNWLFNSPMLTEDKSQYVLHSVDILGPSSFYAVFTGFLLFSSSIIAGWVDNWFVLNNIDERIAGNEAINKSVGEKTARNLGNFFRKKVAGITGNITLGLFLGLLPEILKFMGVPLDVRHVTLSTGSIFSIIPTVGWEGLLTSEFLRACLGILVIGILNVGSSFFFALLFALRAEAVSVDKRNLIFKKLLKKTLSEPWLAILPVRNREHPTLQGEH